MKNCFYCDGKMNEECRNDRRYVVNKETGECWYYEMARMDLAKLNSLQTGTITLRTMLAGYLFNEGKKEKALEILTLPEPQY